MERYLLRAVGVRPFRCVNCDARFYRRRHSDGPDIAGYQSGLTNQFFSLAKNLNCGASDHIQVHHMCSRSRLGDDTDENLTTLCADGKIIFSTENASGRAACEAGPESILLVFSEMSGFW